MNYIKYFANKIKELEREIHCVQCSAGDGGGAVASVFGRIGAVVAVPGDYEASEVTNAVDSTAAYANPAWITSLAWGKITGTPTTLAGYGISDAALDANVVHKTGSESIAGVKTFSDILNADAGVDFQVGELVQNVLMTNNSNNYMKATHVAGFSIIALSANPGQNTNIRADNGDLQISTAAGKRLDFYHSSDFLGRLSKETDSAYFKLAAGVAGNAQMNLAASTTPTTPNNGDIWFDGTDIKMRIGGVTKVFTLT